MSNDAILTRNHPSSFRNQQYIYPVLSRRAGGISIGINLSPTSLCTFRCIYCQVHPQCTDIPGRHSHQIDLPLLETELGQTAELVSTGDIYKDEWFSHVAAEHRVLRDFAFSGDGEPTLSPHFPDAVKIAAKVRRELGLTPVKLVLITNATRLHDSKVSAALDNLIKNNGEVWAKLDAGSPEYYQFINRSGVPYETVLDNIGYAARQRSVVIQTMLLATDKGPADEKELTLYCDRLNKIQESGGTIHRIQLYTIARPPIEEYAVPLSKQEMDSRAEFISKRTGLKTELYYS